MIDGECGIFMFILTLLLLTYVFLSIFYIIFVLLSKQKIQKEEIYLINDSLVIIGIISVYRILFKINEVKVSEFAEAIMFWGTKIIYYLPVSLVFIAIYLVKNILGSREGKEKINSTMTILSIVISTILIAYYFPIRNIINTQINKLYINKNNSIIADTYDQQKISQITRIINNHIFIRSASDKEYNSLNGQEYVYIDLTAGIDNRLPRYRMSIYIRNNIADTLYINDQGYKIQDRKKFARDIYAVIKDFLE
jgi:hypothetical protein